MRNITLRLHRQHDLDLMVLHLDKEYRFTRELKQVLVAYANGEDYEPESYIKTEFSNNRVPIVSTLHITLNENNEREAKAIKVLSGIRRGYHNSFLKALFRTHMTSFGLPLGAYTDNNGLLMAKKEWSQTYLEEVARRRDERRKQIDELSATLTVDDIDKIAEAESPVVASAPIAAPVVTKEKKTESDAKTTVAPVDVVSESMDPISVDPIPVQQVVNPEPIATQSVETSDNNEDEDLDAFFGQIASFAHQT